MHFHLIARVWSLANEVVDATFQKIFLSSLYQFNSIFSGLVWTDKLHSCVEGIYLLNTGCYGNGKMALFQLSGQKFQKIFDQKRDLSI